MTTRLSAILAVAALPLLLSACEGAPAAGPLAILDVAVQAAKDGREIPEKTLEGAARTLDGWCKYAPRAARLALREGINSRSEHGDIIITCDGDLSGDPPQHPVDGLTMNTDDFGDARRRQPFGMEPGNFRVPRPALPALFLPVGGADMGLYSLRVHTGGDRGGGDRLAGCHAGGAVAGDDIGQGA